MNVIIPRGLPRVLHLHGEIVVLNELGRPQFNALMFSRRAPVYVAFDVLYFNGIGRLFNAVCELDLVGCR